VAAKAIDLYDNIGLPAYIVGHYGGADKTADSEWTFPAETFIASERVAVPWRL